jgi:ABC-type nitrate/sulfonate/bicarbonate transport system substrate-binding protein
VGTTLRVGIFTPSFLLELARASGRLGGAGLEVVEEQVTSSRQQFAALRDARYDVVFTNPDNVVAYHFLDDNPLGERLSLRVLAGLDRGLGLGLYRGAHAPADRPGARLGVDVASSGFALVAYELLERAGLDVARMVVEDLGATPRRAEALIEQRCDYTILNAGNEWRATRHGAALVDVVESIGPYLGTLLVTLEHLDDATREAVERLRDVIGATVTAVLSREHDDAVLAAVISRLALSEEGAREHLAVITDPRRGLVADLGVDRASWSTVVRLRRRHRPDDAVERVLDQLSTVVDADVLR